MKVSFADFDLPKQLNSALEKLGIKFFYKEYPVGHGVSPQNFYDFRNWLEENK